MLRLFLLLGLVPAAAAAPRLPAAAAGERIESVHAHMSDALNIARRWIQDPKLYSIEGGEFLDNDKRRHVHWEFVFGDPTARNAEVVAAYMDGELAEVQAQVGSRLIEESYREGRKTSSGEQEAADTISVSRRQYRYCEQIDVRFLDTPAVEDRLARLRFHRPDSGISLLLFRPMEPRCLVLLGIAGAPVLSSGSSAPAAALGRSVWAVTNHRETVVLDAKTGRLLSRRPGP